ncbi:RICIN domain-containing protein [Streptomyces sp. NPDC048484]|uniref:RICIN domain-containing protein n=1 Tax=Streptomyces sp. NPDC048484 TaxID=3155146 RepID=UPI003447EF04
MSAVRLFTAVFATLALATGIGASTATAAPGASAAADPINTFQNRATNECLDDSFGSGLRTHSCNYGPAQQWYVHAWGDGTRRLQNVATGRCLSYVGAGVSFAVGPQTCNDSQEQSWYVDRYGDGLAFRNQALTKDFCLDDSFEYGLRAVGCNALGWQKWF